MLTGLHCDEARVPTGRNGQTAPPAKLDEASVSELRSGKLISRLEDSKDCNVELSGDGTKAYTRFGRLQVWDCASGRRVPVASEPTEADRDYYRRDRRLSPNLQWARYEDRIVHVVTGAEVMRLDNTYPFYSEWSPCSRYLALKSQDSQNVKLWRMGEPSIVTLAHPHVRSAHFSANGEQVAVYGKNSIKIFRCADGAQIDALECPSTCDSVAFEDSDRLLRYYCNDQTTYYDLAGRRIWRTFNGLVGGLTPDRRQAFWATHGEYRSSPSRISLYDVERGQVHFLDYGEDAHYLDVERVMVCCEGRISLWYRRRPAAWWGVAYLPEFWCVAVFGLGFIWSVWRDRKAEP